ncbi:MAG TPA: Rieske (2Fe-2S) protein [Ktedonobacterales bacterium]|nr:Rieske (2Fe-2S) protein [Ktedonobacterales bacterium]
MATTSQPSARTTWQRVAALHELDVRGCKTVHVAGRTLVLWRSQGQVYALDNRCPHMGFPLDRGTCRDGILTCHWHSARFDLRTGGTFDQFADDVQVFPVEVRGEDIWVDVGGERDLRAYYRSRLHDGLEQDIRLVLAKSAIALLDHDGDAREPFRIGLEFGVHNRRVGWGQGLTMLTCFGNLLPHLDAEDRPRAVYQGLDAVSRETSGAAPRFVLKPLPGPTPDMPTLKRWLRQFLAVRDDEGAERVLVSAVRAGASQAELAEMLFAAATDYRYLQIGHALDFVNKALESLDLAGWEPELAEAVLSSLVRGIAQGSRQEESNAWRHPVDLVALLEASFPQISDSLAEGRRSRGAWVGRSVLAEQLLEDDPQANIEALLQALRSGATPEQVAGAVSYAAALRIARFHLSNEFGDWDTTLHTFTFAHAVHLGMRRIASAPAPETGQAELLRGAFDAAMSVYLDRFLNIPPARIPAPQPNGHGPEALLETFLPLLDKQQQVNEAGELVAAYLAAGGDDRRLLATLGKALLREDRDFHSIQTIEAAVSEYGLLRGTPEAAHLLIAAARYLAAHAPTPRAQGQTYQIALRLHRGEKLFEG